MMEMLVALAIFALIVVLASQSLMRVGEGYSTVRSERATSIEMAQIEAFLSRAVRTNAQSDDLLLVETDVGAALFVRSDGNGTYLVWRDGVGRQDSIELPTQTASLRRERDIAGRGVLVLVDQSDDHETVLALVPWRVTARRDCHFDAVGRRCLEPAQ
jgi:type II secretory pathway component PulJ